MLTNVFPEGVYRDPETRQLMRMRLRFRGFVNEAGLPWQTGDGPRYEEHDEVPHPCVVADAGDSPDEIDRRWNEAIRYEQDFYHPRLGWLAFGRKREQEWPQNEGAGVVRYQRRRRPAPVVDATGMSAEPVFDLVDEKVELSTTDVVVDVSPVTFDVGTQHVAPAQEPAFGRRRRID